MNHGFFVTGTDTGVGKTCVSMGLMRSLQRQGHVVVGMKPVASGCSITSPGLLENEDARRLRACASFNVPYRHVNPYAFEPPIAPHLAARAAGEQIEIARIEQACRDLTAEADRVVVEGVGGWLVPINATQTMADVATALGLPVVMVVGIRLGCLNHALLTAAAIRDSGAVLAAWVANRIDAECANADELVTALEQRLAMPALADVPYLPDEAERDRHLSRISLASAS